MAVWGVSGGVLLVCCWCVVGVNINVARWRWCCITDFYQRRRKSAKSSQTTPGVCVAMPPSGTHTLARPDISCAWALLFLFVNILCQKYSLLDLFLCLLHLLGRCVRDLFPRALPHLLAIVWVILFMNFRHFLFSNCVGRTHIFFFFECFHWNVC